MLRISRLYSPEVSRDEARINSRHAATSRANEDAFLSIETRRSLSQTADKFRLLVAREKKIRFLRLESAEGD